MCTETYGTEACQGRFSPASGTTAGRAPVASNRAARPVLGPWSRRKISFPTVPILLEVAMSSKRRRKKKARRKHPANHGKKPQT